MIKSIAALLAVAMISMAAAQNTTALLYVTFPLDGNTITAGQPTNITWTNPSVDVIPNIYLANGPSTNLNRLYAIGQNVDATLGYYVWDVPATQAPGQYALIFDSSPNLAFSGTFIIQASGNATSSGAPTSSASLAPTSTLTASLLPTSGSPSPISSPASSSSPSGTPSETPQPEGAALALKPGTIVNWVALLLFGVLFLA